MKAAYVPPHKRVTPQQKPVRDGHRERPIRQDFDAESGQVYDEVEVVFKRRQNSDWIGEYKNPTIMRNKRQAESGSRSLLDMARSKCIREFRSFTPAHFEAIPWTLASKLWGEVVSTHSESFHAWRTLAKVYNGADEFGERRYRYHLEIKQPQLPVLDYFRGLSSPDVKWLSALRISPKQISIADLVAVASIKNMTVLDLSDGQLLLDNMSSRFEERIMRTWAELASSGKAFQHLQAIMLGWQDDVADWIFKYLIHFPCLRHLITTDCKNIHQKNRADWEGTANAHGWTAHHGKRSVKLLRPVLDDRDFHITAISSLYYLDHGKHDNPVDFSETHDPTMKPLVECWLGTPRRWIHILDEFPGTRTVWFEKNDTMDLNRLQSEPIEPDSTKRLREAGSPLQVSPSPPRKKSYGKGDRRMKASEKTAADLLADMGM